MLYHSFIILQASKQKSIEIEIILVKNNPGSMKVQANELREWFGKLIHIQRGMYAVCTTIWTKYLTGTA